MSEDLSHQMEVDENSVSSKQTPVEPDRLARAQEAAAAAMAQAAEENGTAPPEPDEPEPAEAEVPEPGDDEETPEPEASPEPEEPKPESESDRAVRKALETEKRLREERDALAKEKAEWERLKDLFDVDPAEAIRQGFKKDPFETAENLYNASLGEDAPDDYKEKVRKGRLEKEVQALERRKQELAAEEDQRKAAEYVAQLDNSVTELDATQWPVVQSVLDKKGDKFVQDKMRGYASLGLQQGFVPTPEQLLQAVTDEYNDFVMPPESPASDTTPGDSPAPSPESSKGAKPRSLRNKMSQSRAPAKPYEEMTDQERQADRLARARKAAAAAMAQGD